MIDSSCFNVYPLGQIKKDENQVVIELDKKYIDGLLGLDAFSHIFVCYWFHNNDTPEKRNTLQVHPRGDKKNPLSGVFATHSPARPNLIAISICKILSIRNNLIEIDKIDAFDGTPVIDIKSYIPGEGSVSETKIADWV